MLHAAGRRIQGLETFLKIFEFVEANREVQFAKALVEFLVFLDLFRLGLVLAYGTAGRAQVVFHALHVHLHAFELAHGLLPLLAVLAHARSLFEQHAAVVRLIAKHRLDHVGVHLRIGTRTETGVE